MIQKFNLFFLIFVLCLNCANLHGIVTNDSALNFDGGLNALIVVDSNQLVLNPQKINISATIKNEDPNNDYIIYLMLNNSGIWETGQIIGIAKSNQSTRFDFDFGAQYSGYTYATSTYALVASYDSSIIGKSFVIVEDWSIYEKEQMQIISSYARFIAPILGLLIIAILFFLARSAFFSKSRSEKKREYTLKNFIIPNINNKKPKEVIAQFLIHPLFWLFEVFVLVIILEFIWNSSVLENKLDLIVLTFLSALLMPLVYFLLLWTYNMLVEKMPMRFLAGAFIWGITSAVLSLIINSLQSNYVWNITGFEKSVIVLFTTAIFAPLIEEFTKGIGLFILWGHHEFCDSLHGIHLGLASGLGFAFVENWLYFASKTQPLELGLYAWLLIIIYRSFFNSLAHGCFSAMLGATLGWAKQHGWGTLAFLSIAPGLLFATILHSVFNISAILDGFEALNANFLVFKYNPIMIATLVSLLLVFMFSATIERRYAHLNKSRKKLQVKKTKVVD